MFSGERAVAVTQAFGVAPSSRRHGKFFCAKCYQTVPAATLALAIDSTNVGKATKAQVSYTNVGLDNG